MKSYYIIGAGGHAKQVACILSLVDPRAALNAFLDDTTSEIIRYIHNVPVYSEKILNQISPSDVLLLNGMGRPNRKKPIERLISQGFSFLKLIHPQVSLNKYITIGEGSIIQAGVQLMPDITIGQFVLIDLTATVGHDVTIGDYTTISTGVNLAGGVNVGKGTWIGSGSVVIENVTIGNNTIIGAGSVVTRDIGSNRLAYGVPAKEIRQIQDASEILIKHQ